MEKPKITQEEQEEIIKKIQEESRNRTPEETMKLLDGFRQKQRADLVKRVEEGKAFFVPKEWPRIYVERGDLTTKDCF